MKRNPDDDDPEAVRERAELDAFEARLRGALEARALDAARAAGPPTDHEARQLAAMAAHARSHAHGRGSCADDTVDAPLAPRTRAAGSSLPARRAWRGLQLGALAALVLLTASAVVWRGRHVAPEAATDPYLDGKGEAPEVETVFPGTFTWNDHGRQGVVLVKVFDRDTDLEEPVYVAEVMDCTWEPGPEVALPARFEVRIERPADDGISEERLDWARFRRE